MMPMPKLSPAKNYVTKNEPETRYLNIEYVIRELITYDQSFWSIIKKSTREISCSIQICHDGNIPTYTSLSMFKK